MQIWIISSDITFACNLKQKFLDAFKPLSKETKVELFHETRSFLEKIKKLQKKKISAPDWIMAETQVDKDDLFSIFVNEMLPLADLAGRVWFSSSMNYGSFVAFFEKRSMAPPPFFSKQETEKIIRQAVEIFLEKKENPDRKILAPSLKTRQNKQKLKNGLERITKCYYESQLNKESVEEIKKNLEEIEILCRGGVPPPHLSESTKRLQSFLNQKNATGPLRLKRELRDFLVVAEKIKSNLQES